MLLRSSFPTCEFTAKPQRLTCRMAGRILAPESYKARVKDRFAKRAPSYDQNDTFHPKIAQLVLKHAPLMPGNSVLDVATGTGLVALEVALDIVGPTGNVLGIDISAAMVEQAVAKAGQLKAANVEFVVADVEEYTFPDRSFDAILSSSAIPYLQNVPSTFQRFFAWCKPGGSLVFNTPESPMFQATDTINQLARERFGLRLEDAAAEVGIPDRVEKALYAAGFSNVQVNREVNQLVFKDTTLAAFAERMWTQCAASLFSPLNLALTAEQIEALRGFYLKEAAKQSEVMQVGNDLVKEYTELIVVATA